MKKYIALSVLLIAPILSFGQEKPVKNYVPKPPPAWVKDAREAAESNYIETFADAFKDPNVFIGVFEQPERPTKSVPTTTLSSGKILENIPGYWQAMTRFYRLHQLSYVKSIKGKFTEPVVFVIGPPIMSQLAGPPVPPFIPPRESKWVLALKKTSKDYRIARLGKDVEKYKFLNDRTMFSLFRYGHGALCLKWPEKKKEPRYLVKVPESIVEDLEAIQHVMPSVQKKKMDPNDVVAITKTSKALKTDVAKSIFKKVLADRSQKTQDPNDR